jgi:UDP-N-acetylmuramyl pentapeptide synthase
VLECASRGPGQIRELSLIARPHLGVITAVGPGHLSEFGTIDQVARGKWEIADGLRETGVIVAPGESPYTQELGAECPVVTFGMSSANAVHPIGVALDETETRCTIATPHGAISTTIPGSSRADLMNALCATAAGQQIGVDTDDGTESLTLEEIAEALRSLPSIPGRCEIIVRPSGIEVIFDAYNSNPLSLANALDALGSRTRLSDGSPLGRRVAILGDMLELGDEAERYHREAGRRVAELPIECLITVGELARLIRHAAEQRRGEPIDGDHYPNAEACAEALPHWLRAGDIALIKASRGIALEQLLEGEW